MRLYDVEATVTVRIEAADQSDAGTHVYLRLEELLYGGVMVSDPGTPVEEVRARIDKRAEERGISMRVAHTERVVTPGPYDIGQVPA